jgi:hypothetical protein
VIGSQIDTHKCTALPKTAIMLRSRISQHTRFSPFHARCSALIFTRTNVSTPEQATPALEVALRAAGMTTTMWANIEPTTLTVLYATHP